MTLKNYNKLKRYWKLLLKSQEELNNSKWKKWWCFDNIMTQSVVVDYLININIQLKETCEAYQTILCSLKTKNYNQLEKVFNNKNDKTSNYMKTSIKTSKGYLIYIKKHYQIHYDI